MSTGLLSERLRHLALKPRRELKVADFVQPLYISIHSHGGPLTARVPIVWGQDYVELPVINSGPLQDVFVWDRPEGGEWVLDGIIQRGTGTLARPYDAIILSDMIWP